MQELNWIRRVYRAHLARFAVARGLKRVYLALRLGFLQSRHWMAWHSHHAVHVLRVHSAQGAHAISWRTRRFAHAQVETAAYRARMGLHSASYTTRRFAHQRVDAAAYHTRMGLHSVSYRTRRMANQHIDAAAHQARMGLHGASYQARRVAHQQLQAAAGTPRDGLERVAHASREATLQAAREGGAFAGTLQERRRPGPLNLLRRAGYACTAWLADRVARMFEILAGQRVAFYSLWAFEDYQADTQPATCELVPEQAVDIEAPEVHPAEYHGFLHSGVWRMTMPAIRAFEVADAKVLGKSDLLFLRSHCLHHGLYDFDRDQMFEEVHGHVNVRARQQMLARFVGEEIDPVPAGISLVGSATSNYVHWLTETLPKLALFDEVDAWADLPYIVDDGLHPNIMASLRLLNTRGREVLTLERGKLLPVQKLVAISPVAYVPFDFKPGIRMEKLDIDPGYALYSPEGLNLVREKLVEQLGQPGARRRRLYLRRSAKSRQMANSDEVEALMLELGFDIVEPESLDFAQQVRVFSNADMIVGQGGAAFGNIMFAPPGCHVIVLSTWSPFTIYYYFSNIASLLGQRCSFILCQPVQDEAGYHRAHSGLHVPIQTLKETIRS